MGRTGKQFKFYIKAAKLALELIKWNFKKVILLK
jgi:hypothetical protein